jgi:hypothetical protein
MRQTKVSVSSSEGLLGRLVCSVPEDLIQEVQRTLLDYRAKTSKRASMSAFVEVAIRELLSRQDVLEVLRRYDASAKRVITKRGKRGL